MSTFPAFISFCSGADRVACANLALVQTELAFFEDTPYRGGRKQQLLGLTTCPHNQVPALPFNYSYPGSQYGGGLFPRAKVPF
jgi:hypothetical protein